MKYNNGNVDYEILGKYTCGLVRVQNEQSFNFQTMILCIYFIIGSNSEHVGEESSRAHDNNGTYIH